MIQVGDYLKMHSRSLGEAIYCVESFGQDDIYEIVYLRVIKVIKWRDGEVKSTRPVIGNITSRDLGWLRANIDAGRSGYWTKIPPLEVLANLDEF